MNSFQETTTMSWGKRISDSFAGMLVGFACFIGAFVLLWWGEGRSIERAKALGEGRENVVSIRADAVDTANEGKLVHMSGQADSEFMLADDIFGMEMDALKLRREVEMYQWKESSSTESKENAGGSETQTTTYNYSMGWSDDLEDSRQFKKPEGHENPAEMPYTSEEFVAEDIHVGAFKLSQDFVSQIQDYKSYAVTEENLTALDQSEQEMFEIYNGELSSSEDPAKPQIGDIRIRFSFVAAPTEISVIGKQSQSTVQPFQTEYGSLVLLESGSVDAQTMFAHAEEENVVITWLLRIGGIALMWLGLVLLFRPLRMLGAVLPILGTILGAGIGLVAAIIALALGTLTIAIAWLFYRPLIGGAVLVLGLAFLFGGARWLKGCLSTKTTSASVS